VPLPNRALIRRADGVRARERDGQAFLTDAHETLIFNLNATGAAVWRMLGQPATFGEIADTFATAFPERGRDGMAADLSALIGDLAAHGLVEVEHTGPRKR